MDTIELFLRGMPKLSVLMTRDTLSQGKLLPSPEDEPDFDMLSRLHPLPQNDAPQNAPASVNPLNTLGQSTGSRATWPHFPTLPTNAPQSNTMNTA